MAQLSSQKPNRRNSRSLSPAFVPTFHDRSQLHKARNYETIPDTYLILCFSRVFKHRPRVTRETPSFKNSCLESGPRASFFTRQLTRPWRLVPARATHTNYELILYYLHTQQQLCVLHNKHLLFCTRLHVRRSMLWLARARIYRVPGTKNDNKETARKKDITFFLFLFFLFKRYRSFQPDTLFVARSNVEQKRRYLQRVTSPFEIFPTDRSITMQV